MVKFNKILSDGIHLFSGNLGTVVIGFINLMILSRILSTEEMGSYSLILMIVNLAIILGLNWFDTSIVRHGKEEYIKTKKINKSFWARTVLYIPIVIFFCIILLVFEAEINVYVGIEVGVIHLIIFMFIVNGILNTIRNIYQSIGQMRKSAYIVFWQKLFLALCLLLVFLDILSLDMTTLLIMINLSFFLAVIVGLIGFPTSILRPLHFDREYLKKIWHYSWPQLIGFSGLYVINYIDLYFIRLFLSLHDVGVYSIAYNGFLIISGFIMLIHSLFLPTIVEYRTKKEYSRIIEYFRKIPLFSSGWIVLVIIGIFASQYVIPILFSEKYLEAVPAFNILLTVSVFYFLSICMLPLFNAFDLVIFVQAMNIIKSAINIVADYYLVPIFGITGAAYGTLVSYIVGTLLGFLLLVVKRKLIFHGK